jgi:drug/metabolite transporter (DMT)-like permease
MSRPPAGAYAAWIAICVIWGTTYLAIRIGLEAVPPALMGAVRWITAGVLLAIITRARGEALPARDTWRDLSVQGLLMIGVGNGFVNWSEQFVPSGLAAVIIATSPFFMTGIEALFVGGERLTRPALVGLLVGFAGILVLLWPDLHVFDASGARFAWGVLALQGACLGWAIGSSYSKRHRHAGSVLGSTAIQMLAGGLALLIVGTITGEWSAVHLTGRGVWAIGYLIVAGSLGGFVSYIYALKHLPVALVSLYAYINPLIAVVLGALVAGEAFTMRTALAMAIVFVGIGLVRGMPHVGSASLARRFGLRRATRERTNGVSS